MLSDVQIRSLAPRVKTYKVADGLGLSISVTPKGGKSWYFRYRRPDSRQYDVHLGLYPDLTLKEARKKRDEARIMLANGLDPGREKRAHKESLAETFEKLAREWMKSQPKWSTGHADSVKNRLPPIPLCP